VHCRATLTGLIDQRLSRSDDVRSFTTPSAASASKWDAR
jgi:hypothetical protein